MIPAENIRKPNVFDVFSRGKSEAINEEKWNHVAFFKYLSVGGERRMPPFFL